MIDGRYWPTALQNADFQSARSASALTPSKKVELTLIGSCIRNGLLIGTDLDDLE